MFQIAKKHTIALTAVGIAGLLSVGIIAAQADTAGTKEPTPISSTSTDDTATDAPTPVAIPDLADDSDYSDDSDGRVEGGHGTDDVSDGMNDDMNDAPDDSDGRVDDSGHDDSDGDDSGHDDTDDDSSHGSDD